MPGRARILARKSPAIRYAKFGEHQYVGSLKTTVTSGPSTCTLSMKPRLTNGSSSSGSSTPAIAAYTCASVITVSGVPGDSVTTELSGCIDLPRLLSKCIVADFGAMRCRVDTVEPRCIQTQNLLLDLF